LPAAVIVAAPMLLPAIAVAKAHEPRVRSVGLTSRVAVVELDCSGRGPRCRGWLQIRSSRGQRWAGGHLSRFSVRRGRRRVYLLKLNRAGRRAGRLSTAHTADLPVPGCPLCGNRRVGSPLQVLVAGAGYKSIVERPKIVFLRVVRVGDSVRCPQSPVSFGTLAQPILLVGKMAKLIRARGFERSLNHPDIAYRLPSGAVLRRTVKISSDQLLEIENNGWVAFQEGGVSATQTGTWRVDATWEPFGLAWRIDGPFFVPGGGAYAAAVQREIGPISLLTGCTFTVTAPPVHGPSASTLTAKCTPVVNNFDQPAQVQGHLDPIDASAVITVTWSDGTSTIAHQTTVDANGDYSDSEALTSTGDWTVKATYNGSAKQQAAEATCSVYAYYQGT
jgi:hypothetical protein